MNDSNLDSASLELWENAKTIYLLSLKSAEEKSKAERNLNMIKTVTREGDVINIFAPNSFVADIINNEYANKLKASFVFAGAENVTLSVKIDTTARSSLVVPAMQQMNRIADEVPMQQQSVFVSTLPLNNDFTFSEFVRGPSNSFALSAAEGVVKHPGKPLYNPLFIHGGTGLGKTHLMQAIGNEMKKVNPQMAVCYITAETFLNEYINALQNGRIENFRHRYRNVDMLLVDDVQFLQRGKDNFQEEFFNTFNYLQQCHKQIVMTSDVAPKDLPAIQARLISRFEGGMVQEVESPSYETRVAILKKKLESIDVQLADPVIDFIAEKVKSHVRAMEGALIKVCHVKTSDPSIQLNNQNLEYILKDAIEKEQSMKKLSVEEIQQACAKKFNVSLADILSHERSQSLVTPRQVAMYISRKFTSKGLQEIAADFGKKHATILNGVKTITERLQNETALKAEVEDILSTFGYHLSDSID